MTDTEIDDVNKIGGETEAAHVAIQMNDIVPNADTSPINYQNVSTKYRKFSYLS